MNQLRPSRGQQRSPPTFLASSQTFMADGHQYDTKNWMSTTTGYRRANITFKTVPSACFRRVSGLEQR